MVVLVSQAAGAAPKLVLAFGDSLSAGYQLKPAESFPAQLQVALVKAGRDVTVKYIDPSYAIRSVPANPYDSVYCLRLAQNAVHAALAGRTEMVVGRWHGRFGHIPMAVAGSQRNQVAPDGDLWLSVLEATGQPRSFG